MKRRMLSLLLVMVMVLGMLPTIAFAAPTESSGVYQIGTAEDLPLLYAQIPGTKQRPYRRKLLLNTIDHLAAKND